MLITPCCPTSQSTSVLTFDFGPGFWAMVPSSRRSDMLQYYMQRAWQIIEWEELAAPESLRLKLIVMAAAEAEFLFSAAALNKPRREDSHMFFADFITRSLTVPAQIQ